VKDTEKFHQILKIELQEKSKNSVINAVRELEKVDGILWVGPNYHDRPAALPTSATGTLYPNLWVMHGNRGIQAEEAWNISTCVRNSVRIGIIDTGIANHVDLNANLVAGWDFFNNNAVTDDDAVTEAITWAINNNIDIINYSGGGTSDYPPRRYAIGNYQGLFVSAAGNNFSDNDVPPYYPSD